MPGGIRVPDTDVQWPDGRQGKVSQVLKPFLRVDGPVLVPMEAKIQGSRSPFLFTLRIPVLVHDALGDTPEDRGIAAATAIKDWIQVNGLEKDQMLHVVKYPDRKAAVERATTSN